MIVARTCVVRQMMFPIACLFKCSTQGVVGETSCRRRSGVQRGVRSVRECALRCSTSKPACTLGSAKNGRWTSQRPLAFRCLGPECRVEQVKETRVCLDRLIKRAVQFLCLVACRKLRRFWNKPREGSFFRILTCSIQRIVGGSVKIVFGEQATIVTRRIVEFRILQLSQVPRGPAYVLQTRSERDFRDMQTKVA